jgi:hypothetical protein
MAIRDEVKEHRASLAVVTLSNAQQVHPDPAVRQAFMNNLGVSDVFYPDLRIRALGEREDISALNLAPLMQAYAEQHQVFLHGFKNTALGTGHWNAEGHHVAGKLIAEALCSQKSN